MGHAEHQPHADHLHVLPGHLAADVGNLYPFPSAAAHPRSRGQQQQPGL